MTHPASSQTPWNLASADDAVVESLAKGTGLARVTARILAARGVTTPEEAARFLAPSLERDWLPPSAVPGMNEAADSVAAAIRENKRIVVFGDFDLDGISAAAVAARGLAQLGANVAAFVPRRFDEGYGLTAPALERMKLLSPEVVVTVDCGVSAAEEVAALLAEGVQVVVTDHHEPSECVPLGVPVANPKLDPACPCAGLSGAGVALKLVQATGERLGFPNSWRSLTDLATLGTVADIVPLLGENRALVADGVRTMRERPRPALAALASVAGVAIDSVSSESIAFGLAPRLNAAGRIADPGVALSLLMTDDADEARRLALALDEHNRVRQAAEADLTSAALEQAEREWRPSDRALVVWGDGWHEGVKGIVASRITNAWKLPAIVFTVEEGVARGSGRSVGNVDLFQAVSACGDVLERFGGHAGAVGLTLPAADLPRFRELLLAHLAELPESAFESEVGADALLRLEDASFELAAELDQLAPFGHANAKPRFATRGVFMTARQRVGRANDHLRFAAYDGAITLPAIAFRVRDIERLVEHESAVDLLWELETDEWRGKRRLQLLVRDVNERSVDADAPAAQLVEDLFAHAEAILAREEYHGIDEAAAFHTKLAGVTFEGRQDVLAHITPGTPLRVDRRPENPHDANACALVDPRGNDVGWFNRRLAAALAPAVDAGVEYDVTVAEVTGGEGERSRGVNVLVERRDEVSARADLEVVRAARRSELASLEPEAMHRALVSEFIGDSSLHTAQEEALAHLAESRNTLVVMATGRGKSLIFHVHAAQAALREGSASVFVFPLRALVADQAFHLEEAFGRVGLCVRTVTGETSQSSRDDAFSALREGLLDVVLTTPEFLDHHAARFAAAERVRFVVVDEAHHVGLARASHRPAYSRLDRAIEVMGHPLVLAVTATASNEAAEVIMRSLGIERVVLDPSVRDNLVVQDRRDTTDRDGYLASLVARGGKTIVYVNSRDQSVRIARSLRKRVPDLANRVAFYNGGLTRSVRFAVERAFRQGEISVVVATSAFGEGVNIPDVRNVVLYHLPFNDVEFNQMSGRAGRDGRESFVHVVFGAKDARINDLILGSLAPSRDDMAALYVALRERQKECGPGFEITNAELADAARRRKPGFGLDDRGVSSAIGVFRELGLVESEGSGAYRRLSMIPAPEGKVELENSVRYAEGLDEVAEFAEFKAFALTAEAHVLLERFNRPILPTPA